MLLNGHANWFRNQWMGASPESGAPVPACFSCLGVFMPTGAGASGHERFETARMARGPRRYAPATSVAATAAASAPAFARQDATMKAVSASAITPITVTRLPLPAP